MHILISYRKSVGDGKRIWLTGARNWDFECVGVAGDDEKAY